MKIFGLGLLGLASIAGAVKFELEASHHPIQKCVWNYALTNTLVVVSLTAPGDDPLQRLDMEIVDSSEHKNIYQSKRNIRGEARIAITTHANSEFGVCLKNTLDVGARQSEDRVKTVDLDIDIGADAIDYNAIAKQESLSGVEVEMRRMEETLKEVIAQYNHLKQREARMRDTNETTNERVRIFFIVNMLGLVVLTVWQSFHLRAYFKKKYLID